MEKAIKRLEKYSAEDHRFSCIRRAGSYAIFQQHTYTGYPVGYEVIVIQRNKKVEYPPTSEQWGTFGWTHTQLESAEKKFAALCKNGGVTL